MTGQSHFNEVFFTDVEIPVDHRIGAEGDGWRLAKVTLGNERVSLSEGGVLLGHGAHERRGVRRCSGPAVPLHRSRAPPGGRSAVDPDPVARPARASGWSPPSSVATTRRPSRR